MQFNISNKEDITIYTNFLLNNKIISKEVNIINVPTASSKEILQFKTQIGEKTNHFLVCQK